MKKIKVIQLSTTSSSFWLNIGKGSVKDIVTDEWFAQVAKQLKKREKNLEIECWSLEKQNKEEKEFFNSNIKFRIFPTFLSIRPGMELSFQMINALKKEAGKCKKENKKLILHFHEHHSWQVYFILLFLKKQKNLKIISQHHGGRSPLKNLLIYKRLFLFFPIIAIMQFFENLLFKKINIFYLLGNNEETYIKKIAPKSLIKFQTMGISEEYFEKANKEKARKTLGFRNNEKYALFLGRIKTTKGIRELLKAFKELENEKVKLELVGSGPDDEKYKEYAQKIKLKNVNFAGPVYGKEKMLYLSACDFLVLPSHTEGAPVVIMEALAKNLLVIASNVGAIPKMIENEKNGILIKSQSSEEIVKSIKDILSWKEKNVKEYAEKYKWRNIIRRTLEDYKD